MVLRWSEKKLRWKRRQGSELHAEETILQMNGLVQLLPGIGARQRISGGIHNAELDIEIPVLGDTVFVGKFPLIGQEGNRIRGKKFDDFNKT